MAGVQPIACVSFRDFSSVQYSGKAIADTPLRPGPAPHLVSRPARVSPVAADEDVFCPSRPPPTLVYRCQWSPNHPHVGFLWKSTIKKAIVKDIFYLFNQ